VPQSGSRPTIRGHRGKTVTLSGRLRLAGHGTSAPARAVPFSQVHQDRYGLMCRVLWQKPLGKWARAKSRAWLGLPSVSATEPRSAARSL